MLSHLTVISSLYIGHAGAKFGERHCQESQVNQVRATGLQELRYWVSRDRCVWRGTQEERYNVHELLHRPGAAEQNWQPIAPLYVGSVQFILFRKFMKVLTKEYLTYAEMKRKPDWAPNVIEDECERIKGKVISLEKSVEMAIMEVMKFLDDSAR